MDKKEIMLSGVFAALGALIGAFCSWFTYVCVKAGEPAWCTGVLLGVGIVGVACCGYISREVEY